MRRSPAGYRERSRKYHLDVALRQQRRAEIEDELGRIAAMRGRLEDERKAARRLFESTSAEVATKLDALALEEVELRRRYKIESES